MKNLSRESISYPDTQGAPVSIFFPAFVLGLFLLGVNIYWLWEWRADQISGDVLIHLLFSRNFAEGRWFEYAIGQSSRANTTILWEWIVALLGIATGQVRSIEGLLNVTRIFAMLCVGFTGWRIFRWNGQLGLTPRVAAVVAVFLMLNPVTFYWTAVNPMETGMTLVFTILLTEWIWQAARMNLEGRGNLFRQGLIGGLWVFALSLIRPELLALAPVAALAFVMGGGLRKWPLGVGMIVSSFALTLLQMLALVVAGLPILPTATHARRMIALTYDTVTIPWLDIPLNTDPWLLMLGLSPLLAAVLIAAFAGQKEIRPVYFFALGFYLFTGLFFSFYYFTTWQGRYMLPAVMIAVPLAASVYNRVSFFRHAWIVGTVYGLVLCGIVIRPLAWYADAPAQRAKIEHFVEPPADAKVFLVQEVQFAYFHPQIFALSTEGLITLEAFQAYKKGQTLYDFIMEYRPDLVGYGRYYLKDPDGLQEKINDAALAGKNLDYRDLHLSYLGEIKGSGPFSKATYSTEP